jgi:serpin B
MRSFSRWSFVLSSALLGGCSSTYVVPDESGSGSPNGAEPDNKTGAPLIIDAKSDLPAATANELSAFARASNAFAGDLYKAIASKDPGNVFFSPASITTALAMTWVGARGATRDEMTKVLHFQDEKSADPNALVSSAARVLVSLNDPKRTDYTLSIVNRLFGEQSYGFDDGFLDITKKQFGAELAKVDFKEAFEPARATINGYVEKETRQRIKDLIPLGALDDLTRLVLVNAIYMHADWAEPFAKEATSAAPFHVSPDKTIDVDTMHGRVAMNTADADGTLMVDLPYKGGDLSMTILMPHDTSKLGELEAKIEAGGLGAMIGKLQARGLELSMPKFKIDPAASLPLGDVLVKLGMPLAFDEVKADFSGMSKPGQDPLHISKVFHKAFVAVDEAGTEAAAATAVIMSAEAAIAPSDPIVVDQPFVFVIRDKKSGLVLFMGRLVDPKA